ncbi:MAG: hypothetical protein U0527_02610 [Candidatus Eisenbacteria bacterium]
MVGLLGDAKGFDSLLQPAARDLGLEVVTHWRGGDGGRFPDETLLPPGFIARLYARMDLYAMLSQSEGTPMPPSSRWPPVLRRWRRRPARRSS